MENLQTDEFAESEGYRLAKEALTRRRRLGAPIVGMHPASKSFEKHRDQADAFLRGWMRAVREWKESSQ